jgi:hypothetical protein
MYTIRMGVPEMSDLWSTLQAKAKESRLSKDEAALYKKWGKALTFLSANPRHPGLASHEIDDLSRRYGQKVWQSYLENNAPGAGRMFWVYGPGKGEITIIGLEPHPESRKSTGYKRIRLSAQRRTSKKE